MKNYVLFALLTLVLVSCAPDPREAAAAYAERSDANARSAEAEQEREQDAEEHEMAMQNKRAAQAEWQTAVNRVIVVAGYVAMIAVAVMIAALGGSASYAMAATAKAYGTYIETRMDMQARLIPLDKGTHQYPLLVTKVGQGNDVQALVNPNDNSVILFNVRNPADVAKVRAMANVQFAGEVATNARLSHKPEAIVTIPQIIESE